MRFGQGSIEGLWVIDLEPVNDHRGFFARTWCEREFSEHGLRAEWPQQNMQYSPHPGTMRGLHYQAPPHSEVKLVRCTRGAVFDVAIDLRRSSPTFGKWSGLELSASEHRAVWVPKGCAHGYLTLEPESEVFYLTSNEYVPSSVRGVRFDDPAFNVSWPRSIVHVPDDYHGWPDFTDANVVELASIEPMGNAR